jgi:16S rRNA (guanine527-N7)-methyltransferase
VREPVALGETFDEALARGLESLGLSGAVDETARALLRGYAERLLRWNRRVNLTSVTEPGAVAEVHVVDSLAVLRTLGPVRTLLDVGSGAGLPGVAIACARRELAVTCCDSVRKKVAFVKAVAAELDLPVRARSVRAQGWPEREGLEPAEAVVSRAVTDPARWLALGRAYVREGGVLLAMLGRGTAEGALRALGEQHGLTLEVLDRFRLPRSGAERAVARFRRA